MSSFYGTSEIVELKDEPNHQTRAYGKEKRPQGCSKFLEDDINKLFEGISVRTSFNGLSLSDEMGATPRRNPMKKPMRMSMSSSTGIGYSEPISIKQALRGLCISQASEMAAIKRLSKPPGSPALSDSGKLANLYKSVVKASENKDSEFEISHMPEESTSNSSGKMPMYPNDPKMKSYNNSTQSSPRLNLEKSIKIMGNEPKMKSYNNSTQSSPRLNLEKSTKVMGSAPRLNEILREPEFGNISKHDAVQDKMIISNSNLSPLCNQALEDSLKSVKSNSEVKNFTPSKVVNKPAPKLRRKGKLQSLPPSSSSINGSKSGKSTRTTRTVKTVIRNKNLVKKKSKQDSTSPSAISSASTVTDSKLICERCHCTLKDPQRDIKEQDFTGKNGSTAKNTKSSKCGDKGEFTQSSNSSVGEYSSSTSISEESNLRDCIIGNRPHMSKDRRWQAIHHMMKQNGFLGLRHFNLLKKLGCGDIGTVYLAELIGTNCPFAIKVMDNEFLERRKKMPRAHTERDILRTLDHPFLPTLYAHFVSENLSCLVMEYCPGGDLHVLRQKQPGRFFHEQAARFYVAEVLLALEYLHMLGIVYRDLKPENILVREDGHIMLTDFDLSLRCSVNPTLLQSPSSGTMEPPRISGPCAGSSCIDPFCIKPTCQVSCFSPRILPAPKGKKTKADLITRSWPQLVAEPTEARSNSFVGTHEYLAPEIIKGDGHGSAVDWWTFGIFLYELLYGKTPFKGSGNDETLANVVLDTLKFPETPLVSFQARDLIKGLLAKEPENRLGSQRGAAEIKQHPFFDGLNWALIRCAVPPELPEPYDISVPKSASLEKAKKYLDYNGGSGGNLEFELF